MANNVPATAKHSTALTPFRALPSSLAPRAAVAGISSTSKNPATEAVTERSGAVSGGAPSPGPMRKERREVALPSQEGKQGVMQYALYD